MSSSSFPTPIPRLPIPPELIFEMVKFIPLKCNAARSAAILHQFRPLEPFQSFCVKELCQKAVYFWGHNSWHSNENIVDDGIGLLIIDGETESKAMTILAHQSPPLLDRFFVAEFTINRLWAGQFEWRWMGCGFCFGRSFVGNGRLGEFRQSFSYGNDGKWIRMKNEGGQKFGKGDVVICAINPMRRMALLLVNGRRIGRPIDLESDLSRAAPALSFATKRYALWAKIEYKFYILENL